MTDFNPIFLKYKGVNEIPVVENPAGDGNFFFYDGAGLKQAPMSVIYGMVQGVRSVLKAGDPKPTGMGAVGKYELSDFAEYPNLVPIIPIGSTTPTSTPIETEDGFYNAVYFDGTNFTQIKVEMPNTKAYSRQLLRTSLYPAQNGQESISFTVDAGNVTQLTISNIRLSYKGNFAETDEDYIFDVAESYGYVVATFTDYVAGGITLEYFDGFEWSPTLTENQFIVCFINDGVLYSNYSEIQSVISSKYYAQNDNNISNNSYQSLLRNFKIGTIDWQNGFQSSDSFDGECLNITGYIVLPMKPKNTKVRILVKGGSNAQIRLGSTDLTSFYFIYQTGGTIAVGKTGAGVLGSDSSVVDASKDYFMEVLFADGFIRAKAWNVTQKTGWDVNVTITEDLGSTLTLNEYAGTTKIKDILYYDNTVELFNKVQFNGYFFEGLLSGEKLIRTFSQGVSFEFETNSSKAVINGVVNSSHTPTIAVSVDGAKPMILNLNSGDTIIFENLSAGIHQIKVWIDGLYEADPYWNDSTKGVFIRDIVIDDNCYIRKPIDNRKSVRIDGDSITEGVNVRTTGALPVSNSGYNVYSNTMARMLNLKPLVHGFGATGIVVDGSGGVPKFLTSISNYCSGKRVFNEDVPDYILVNGGTNDAGASISSGTFVTEYQAYIDYNRNRYPLSKMILLVPFNGSFKTQIIALGATNSLDVIDMSLFTGITTTDGTHPDINGTIELGRQLAEEFKILM